ncbi:MAG: AAA family ATPase [Bacteroidota bacterium]
MLKLPYGRSDFASLIEGGYHYVDRTRFIGELEQLGESYLIFLRPRRFGKSLWISTLSYYYGLQHKDKFEALFGNLDIGKQPTPLANSYLVLHFDFSGVNTTTKDRTYAGFLVKLKQGFQRFFDQYGDFFDPNSLKKLFSIEEPAEMMVVFLGILSSQPRKVYLLIDEYDHFTNELVSFDIDQFQDIVSKQGWVRKFYEVVKTGTGQGLIDRIFMTGVSPVTLDSLTSGFNIGADHTQSPYLHELMGFKEQEVRQILTQIVADGTAVAPMLELMRSWYNGYTFTIEGEQDKLYNPDMVLYFCKEFQRRQAPPPQLLDTNIVSDYGKIKRIFQLGGKESAHFGKLKEVLQQGQVTTRIVPQFSFERDFTPEDFLSLMFYTGLLTIKQVKYNFSILGIPNLVIEKLYFDFFRELIEDRLDKRSLGLDIQSTVLELSDNNQPKPLFELVANTLNQLSNRDFLHFNETGLKMVMLSYLHMTQMYTLQSEYEANRGYVDLLLLHRPPINTPYQFAFELKYLKQKESAQLETALEEGRAQLRRYLTSEALQTQPDLRAWLVVFVGTEMKVVEEVFEEISS